MLTLLQTDPSALQITWFCLIALLWVGFFFLEGFDFGVAMLLPILGRNNKEKRVMINTIGPVWDGNEVWLLTAGGATFAAFPGWYSTLFSGLYLPLLVVLLGLIMRGVAFEYRHKRENQFWKNGFDWAATIGSFLPSLVFGVGFANFVRGIEVGPDLLIAQSFWSLFNPFALLGGVLFVALFLTHGAVFVALKTRGDIRHRAGDLAQRGAMITGILMLVFVLWQNLAYPASENPWLDGSLLTWMLGILAVLGLVGTWFASRADREGWAFLSNGSAIIFLMVGIFVKMYGNLGFISTDPDNPLDIITASSSPYTLTLMTWAAAIFVPVIVAYQAWSYWVFRKRISTNNMPDDAPYPEHAGA